MTASIDDLLRAAAGRHGDREAYVEPGGERLTFAEWDTRSDALAAALVAGGISTGDVVALMLPSGIDYAICYAAVARLGAVATGLNARLGPREVTAILDRARPALIVHDPVNGPPLPRIGMPVLTRNELADLYSRPAPGSRRTPPDPSAPVVIIWTSGTTGTPKGAWFDVRNLLASAGSSGVMSAPGDRRLVATPFAHAGYMAKLADQLVWGITLVISPVPWSAAGMARIMREERITVVGGVPTQWAKLLDEPDATRLPDLRVGIAATAPAPPDLVEAVAARLGVPLVVRYAMTESPTICGTEPSDPPEVQFRTVGRPQLGMEVAVTDPDGRPVPPGEVGRIRVRGGCVMRGYWRDPERTAAALTDDGWLLSGDLGRFDVEGNLILVGRAGDLYIRGGYNVHPVEVENTLAEHPGVRRAAVVGRPTPVIGEIGVAYVVPADPAAPPTLAELRTWTRDRLADYKAPDELVLVDDLPVTAMLKLDRAALRVRSAADRVPAPVDQQRG
ncbi:class I adenylate-forming enzyme family protein [Cryptosporangium aurantiacum]|uniref:Acyl-CoA synthetase (AMP-forming)/AMP-acid ligase II n=1 Tax=Cryptosporangium aurantiacum TaxID=134849 RepID=A0A1M7PM82_9ACTN|nr:class I adenylate-forming enzyme family protein [Cryptosporangium aurantiacum]SHN18289.1 Acyl-CoA synthetase (AMP-forming)/AMP-acid ligase II [Cryptosporangium aurantiacum]